MNFKGIKLDFIPNETTWEEMADQFAKERGFERYDEYKEEQKEKIKKELFPEQEK